MSDGLQQDIAKLERQLSRQKRLAEASYALHSSLDLEQLLSVILKVAAEGVGAERGTVFLVDAEQEQIWSLVLSGDDRLEIRLPVGKGIAGSVAETGETVRIDDAYDDPRFDRSWDEKTGYRTKQILCAPIRNRASEVIGVFQLLNRDRGNFTAGDEEYLASLSIHVSLAIENAQLHKSAVERERFDREVRLAQGVQRQLQPERRDLASGKIVASGMNELCEDATGDYYDLLFPLPGERIGVAIGDVSGHGLQAALVMAEARAFLRAFVQTITSLPEALNLLNDFLVPDMSGGKFMSMFAAVIDTESGAMEWVNAGHNPPLLYRAATKELLPLEATGRILGILEDAAYRAGAETVLEPGDVLLLYTDGVTEARTPEGDLYEQERLESALVGAVAGTPREILAALRAEVRSWTAGLPNDDDLTMVAVKRV